MEQAVQEGQEPLPRNASLWLHLRYEVGWGMCTNGPWASCTAAAGCTLRLERAQDDKPLSAQG